MHQSFDDDQPRRVVRFLPPALILQQLTIQRGRQLHPTRTFIRNTPPASGATPPPTGFDRFGFNRSFGRN
ncbi:MAG TPA: hypothetical protein VHE13_15015 [Opitutus sp.]|nr:hypothetical protein [Opitutus sp.]